MNIAPFHPSRARGFTLIELMVTVMVMAIVLGIAVPSFVDTIRNDRLASASNELITSFTVARSESIKRGIQVSLCTRDGDKCATGADKTDWSKGWLMFTDDLSPTGQIDGPTDVVLSESSAGSTKVTMSSAVPSITFSPQGALAAGTVEVSATGCTGKNKRKVGVQLTGRVELKKESC